MLDRLRARFGWLDTGLASHERVNAVGGGPLASSIALAGALSLFPLLLVAIAVLGFLSANDEAFAAEVVKQLGFTGSGKEQVLNALERAEHSRRAASLIGLLGLLWAGLGVVGTLEQALNATWQVRGRPGWKSKLVDLAWVVGAGLVFLGSAALSAWAGELPGPVLVPTAILGFAVDAMLLLLMFCVLTNLTLPVKAHLPGAVAGGAALEVLRLIGTVYVPRLVSSASTLYGSLGGMFAFLVWLAIGSRVLVYACALNVVLYERAHGTVTVGIEVPHIEGEFPLAADRGGSVTEVGSPDEGSPADGRSSA
jgi:membrane protein